MFLYVTIDISHFQSQLNGINEVKKPYLTGFSGILFYAEHPLLKYQRLIEYFAKDPVIIIKKRIKNQLDQFGSN